MSAKTPTRHDLKTYAQQLRALAARLSGEVTELTDEALRPTGIEGTTENPANEPAALSSEGDEEVARTVLMSEEQLLAEVHTALARLEAGTFGRCERCGRPIGKSRLDALPYARHCIHCARAAGNESV